MSTNTIYILIVSYYLFGERIKPLQLIGVLMMVTAVCIVSLFTNTSVDFQFEEDIAVDDDFAGKVLTILGGLASAFFFGSQLLVFKLLASKVKDGYMIAYTFLFIASFYGIIGMLYMVFFEPYKFAEHDFTYYLTVFLTGILLSIAIVCINIAADLGIAGVCNAIMHNQVIIVTVFNAIIMDQSLNIFQALGVGLCVFGAVLISVANLVQCNRK